jgi:hypothetical protein
MCNQSLQKVLMRSKKCFFLKNSIWVSKNAEFHVDFESVEKVLKKCTKKRDGNMPFLTFTHVRQTCFAYIFLVHFLQLFQRIRFQSVHWPQVVPGRSVYLTAVCT